MGKRLNQLHKDTRASKDLTARSYLAGLSFGPSSSVLAELLDDTARRHQARKSSSPFKPVIVHVDTDLSSACGESPAQRLLDEYRQRFTHVTFVCVPLADVLAVESVDWSTLPLDDKTPDDPGATLQRLLDSLPTVTSRADVLRQLIRHLLLHAAISHSCSALLLGHSTTALAALTLSEVANGRGFAVPLQVADGHTTVCTYERGTARETGRLEFPVYYPMREVFRNEMLQYIKLVPSLSGLVPEESRAGASVVSHKDLSIEEVMARYFNSVEEGYSGIVANVVRTTGKLERMAGDRFCGTCGMTLDVMGDMRWAGELGDDVEESGAVRLCYGCKRSVHG